MNRRTLAITGGGVVLAGIGGAIVVGGGSGSSGGSGGLMRAVRQAPVTLRGDVGGEKLDFIRNPDVVRLLDSHHAVTLDVRRAGSMEMARNPSQGADFIWPAHDAAADIAKNLRGQPKAEENVFSSPLVILTWKPVSDALTRAALVETRDGTHYLTKMRELVEMSLASRTWESLGLTGVFGAVNVVSTHPALSNSGLMFASLVAGLLNGGRPPSASDVDRVGPAIRTLFERQGRMEDSSGRVFRQFLSQGMGAFPLLVAYENQLTEYWESAPENERRMLVDRVRVLYPVPTMFATHPLMALTDKGRRLVEALRDPEIRAIAWTRHGYRFPGSEALPAPAAARALGMPATPGAVMPMPSAAVVEDMLTRYIPAS